ncbi:MAG: hypothetical protein HYZ44_01665 [Bacteroidetes bacterium]|nr:hypothetical protein [Bacteroidota bacterium]
MKLSFITLLLSLIMVSGNAQNSDTSRKENRQLQSATHRKGDKDHQHRVRGGKKKRDHHSHAGHRHHKNGHRHHHSH